MRRLAPIALASLALAACASTGASNPSTGTAKPEDSSTTAASASPAVMLASIQKGTQVSASDPLAESLQMDLDRVKPDCRETTMKTASEIDEARTVLAKDGIAYSEATVAKALVTVSSGLTARSRPTDCASLLAAWLTQVEGS